MESGLAALQKSIEEAKSRPARRGGEKTEFQPRLNYFGWKDGEVKVVRFLTDDINRDYQRLVGLGVDFTNPPVAITEGVNAGGAACYFRDPDRITLELLMPSPERLASLARIRHLSSVSMPTANWPACDATPMMSDEMRGLLAALAERLDRAGISGGIRVVGGSVWRLALIMASIVRDWDFRARSSASR